MFTANVEAPDSAGLQFSGLIMLRHAFRLCSSRIVRPEHVYGVSSMVGTGLQNHQGLEKTNDESILRKFD